MISETMPPGCSVADVCSESPRPPRVYVQPRRREACRPAVNSCPPNADMETRSTYRQSYKPVGQIPCNRNPAIVPQSEPSLWPTECPKQPLARTTTYGASFPGWPGAERPPQTVPGDHEMGGGCGPMQDMTSQRHDYVSKGLSDAERPRPARPVSNLGGECSACPMASMTTTAASFTEASWAGAERRPMFRPPAVDCWLQPPDVGRMAVDTVMRSSYRPYDAAAFAHSTRRPWTAFCRPTERVNGCTVYKGSYRPPGEFRELRPGECAASTRYLGNCGADADDGFAAGRLFYPRAHDYNLYHPY